MKLKKTSQVKDWKFTAGQHLKGCKLIEEMWKLHNEGCGHVRIDMLVKEGVLGATIPGMEVASKCISFIQERTSHSPVRGIHSYKEISLPFYLPNSSVTA
jgi:hypothetical protein